jgi:hypothetical protein
MCLSSQLSWRPVNRRIKYQVSLSINMVLKKYLKPKRAGVVAQMVGSLPKHKTWLQTSVPIPKKAGDGGGRLLIPKYKYICNLLRIWILNQSLFWCIRCASNFCLFPCCLQTISYNGTYWLEILVFLHIKFTISPWVFFWSFCSLSLIICSWSSSKPFFYLCFRLFLLLFFSATGSCYLAQSSLELWSSYLSIPSAGIKACDKYFHFMK